MAEKAPSQLIPPIEQRATIGPAKADDRIDRDRRARQRLNANPITTIVMPSTEVDPPQSPDKKA